MEDKIIATYCLCDDLCKQIHAPGDAQQKMTDAEIMTTALVAALCFRGTLESARIRLKTYRDIPSMLSKSRFSRRLHGLRDTLMEMFLLFAQIWKTLHNDAGYVIDSLPIPVCDNDRIPRAQRYRGHLFRGSIPSKKRDVYGLKAPLMVTKDGQLVLLCYLGFHRVKRTENRVFGPQELFSSYRATYGINTRYGFNRVN